MELLKPWKDVSFLNMIRNPSWSNSHIIDGKHLQCCYYIIIVIVLDVLAMQYDKNSSIIIKSEKRIIIIW